MSNTSNYSLRSWVLILTLAPTVIVSILLGGFFTFSLFNELENTLESQGTNIIDPLAIAAEQNLQNNNREALKVLIDKIHRKHTPLINSIAVFTNNNKLYVTSNYHRDFDQLKIADNQQIPLHTSIESTENFLIIRSPISIENKGVDDQEKVREVIGFIVLQINREHALLQQHRVAVTTFIIILIGIQLNLFFTFRLVNNVTQPITEMVRAVAKIREGKLDTRLQGELVGELDILKRGINAMAGSLKEYNDEMQYNIDTATSDLRETMEQVEIQNIELDIAKRKAQEANRVKSEFLANMSHELRTPLNGVIGFTRQLLKTPLQSSQNDYLQTIEKSATNLLGIINDILDFSKLEAGKLHLEKLPLSLRDSVDEVVNLISSTAHEKGLDILVRIKPDTPDNFFGDAQRIQQILTNLIGNAVKFTEHGKIKINISTQSQDDSKVKLYFEVIDSGIGISHSQQSKLFNAFAQADSSISRRYGGTGLGLVITRRLVEEMGGNISCVSEPGVGSRFSFTMRLEQSDIESPLQSFLPLDRRVQIYNTDNEHLSVLTEQMEYWQLEIDSCSDINSWEQLSQAREYDNAIINFPGPFDDLTLLKKLLDKVHPSANVLVLLNSNDLILHNQILEMGAQNCFVNPVSTKKLYQAIERREQAAHQHIQVKELPVLNRNAEVLVVDDNEANLKLIMALLEDKVSHITSCVNGQEAVNQCQQTQFDMIFMDIQMPVLDGIQATTVIRKQGLNQMVPIIATTAHAMNEEKQHLLAQGMNDILTKPLDETLLDRMLNKWLKGNTFPAQPKPEQHIDWQLALKQAANKPDLAREMLQMLVDTIPDNMQQIEQAVNANDHQQLQHLIHKLNGACCYTGVPRLNKLANEIESALKRETAIADIEPELLELQDELQHVATEGSRYLNETSELINE